LNPALLTAEAFRVKTFRTFLTEAQDWSHDFRISKIS